MATVVIAAVIAVQAVKLITYAVQSSSRVKVRSVFAAMMGTVPLPSIGPSESSPVRSGPPPSRCLKCFFPAQAPHFLHFPSAGPYHLAQECPRRGRVDPYIVALMTSAPT